MMKVFRINHTSLTTENKEPPLQLQCITTKVMKCFKVNKLFQDNIVMCLEDEYIHRKAQ